MIARQPAPASRTTAVGPRLAPASVPEVPRRRPPRIGGALILGGIIVLALLVCVFLPDLVAPVDPTRLNVAAKFQPPSAAHWMGTDEVGRDLWSRIVHGTRFSVGMAIAVVALGALIGTIYGAAAGFLGGKSDEVMMRVVDVFLSLPAFILAMAIAASIGRGIGPLIAALVIVWWPSYARLVRGMVLGLKERPHVEGARSLGAAGPYIVRRHIAPLTMEQLNVRVTQDVGYALVAVASLSFIGLGVQPPTPEWGLLLSGARAYITSSWWYPVFPGLAIALATVGFALFGDGCSELFTVRQPRQ